MRTGAGVLFVVLGLFLLWLAITGRLDNLPRVWAQLTAPTTAGLVSAAGVASSAPAAAPQMRGYVMPTTFGVPPNIGLPVALAPMMS
jgi:hypothetical protein